MPDLVRLSLSIERPLFEQFERLVKSSRYTNRSEFVRDMIRRELVTEEWEANAEVLGTLTLIYDHHVRGLLDRLNDLQHEHHAHILAVTHVHLDADLCAEVIILRDKARAVRALTDALRQLKGVLHAELSMASTGETLRGRPRPVGHRHAR